jgi:hypothetical protein
VRPDQIKVLTEIEEKLIDVFTTECKPADWPGMENDKKRNERYWVKKNALATLRLVGQIDHLLRDIVRADRPEDVPEAGKAKRKPEAGDDAIAREAASLERRGKAVLRQHGVKVSH